MSYMFCTGSTLDENIQRSLEVESQEYGDLVQGDFLDNYYNLSYKGIMGNLWVAEFCSQAEFLVKTDDDMFVDMYEVKKCFIDLFKDSLIFVSWDFHCRCTPLQENTSPAHVWQDLNLKRVTSEEDHHPPF